MKSAPSPVYFSSDLKAAAELCQAAGLGKIINQGDFVALKIHFGERGNTGYIRPELLKSTIAWIKQLGGRPFWLDANTLYKGSRSDALAHQQTAADHGFTPGKTGAPVLIADGLTGRNSRDITVAYKHFNKISLGALIFEADSLLAITHFKGHEVTGFGGVLKNLGMGLGSRAGKQQMHADIRPQVSSDRCQACGRCLKWCPTAAISWDDGHKARIDQPKCIGCAECVAACRYQAISISWAGTPDSVQEKMVEYAAGAISLLPQKIGYLTFLNNINPACDCFPTDGQPIVADIGFLAVAIDQAAIDLVNQKAGKDIFRQLYPAADWSVQLDYAAALGLGSRRYELVIK